MAGLLFLIVGLVWFAIAGWAAVKLGRFVKRPIWRFLATCALIAFLVPLPVMDEIVGAQQFKRLCNSHSAIEVAKDSAGRTVYLLDLPQTGIDGAWVKVRLHPWRFVDATMKEIVVSYDTLFAEGGHLFPGFDSGHDPLTFTGECWPGGKGRIDNGKLLDQLKIKRVNAPTG